jgi:omega-6 fatty acid desaturase (delta-12 desaturase)
MQGGRSTFDGQRKGGHVLDHFRPSSKLFDPKIRHKIVLGTAGILAFLAFLAKCCVDYGAMAVACYYFGPYLVVNGWLVLYTWLHHTDVNVPHFGADEWTWVKGALCTIDRPYGIFDWFHHDIGSTHVVHHLFSNMPFYHAAEATVHVKQFLGPLYNYDETPIIRAAWKIAAKCQYMDSVEGVQYYKAMPRSKKAD